MPAAPDDTETRSPLTTGAWSTADAGTGRPMRVLVSGSSGFIGRALRGALESAGHVPVRLVRGPATGPDQISWDIVAGRLDPGALAGIDAVVHLSGAGIGDHRWTGGYKREILDSRVKSTDLLVATLIAMDVPPSVLVSGSAIGFYGNRGDEELTEESAAGTNFLALVTDAWEGAAAPAAAAGIRTVLLRSGLVFDRGGGTLARLLPLFSSGLGGAIGKGTQWWSWIALDDEIGAILHSLDTAGLRGPVNATAPNPVTNAEFTKALGRALRRPTALRVPARVLGLALGRERAGELMLTSQRVLPRALERSGFRFRYPTLAEFLATF
ncbi:MAG TPA: TIGR01777 family oxidoreductase [Acidimicrobiales bacterium]|nr:TIGR01777 family oxidoreductase [Acidimicrobiales bacterium]